MKTIENRFGAICGVAVLLVAVVGYASYRNTARLFLVNYQAAQANERLAAAFQTYSSVEAAETQFMEFITTGEEQFRARCAASMANARRNFERLRALNSHDSGRTERLTRLSRQMENSLGLLEQDMNQSRPGPSSNSQTSELLLRADASLRPIRRDLRAIQGEEGGVLAHHQAESAADVRTTIHLIVIRNVLALLVLLVFGAVLYYDIVRRVKAERALRSSERQYRSLFENAPLGIYRTTPAGRILAANPALVKMLGFSSFEELATRDLNTSGFEPQYPRSQFTQRLEQTGEVAALECAWHKRDGEVLHVRENARVIRDDSGSVLYYEGTVEDITQSKRAQAEHARLVTAIEQSGEAVVITNTAGAIEYVNPAFTRITGYGREEVLTKNPRILKSDKQGPEFYRQLWETILKGRTWQGELVNRRKNGALYTEHMSIGPVRDALGELTHFIATKQDVTERKSLEAQLQQAARIEAIGRLAGGVAHDFNNLLTVINGYTELLQERFAADNQASAHLKEIKNAGERAATLTRQLLAFSRRQVLAPQVLDLNELIANLEKMLKRLIGEHIELRTMLCPGLWRVKADPGQVDQVIMNLAVNARDAMPMGGKLTIETSNVELDSAYALAHVTVKPGLHVMLAVSDNGTGMTPETKARIFEPFFTTKEQGKGTGLGLSTVYGIVKQSEGSIWVYSEPGQGTAFKIYFPAVSESLPVKERAAAKAGSDSGSETIMVLEDEEGVLSLIRLALGSAGYQVLEADDPERALALCADHNGPVHLLLTDVVMPKMPGPTVAQRAAELRPGIKVLYMSGYTDDAIVHHGVLREGLPFIQKPFSPMNLRKKVREVLDRK